MSFIALGFWIPPLFQSIPLAIPLLDFYVRLKMKVMNHTFWGDLEYRDGYDEWSFDFQEDWPSHGPVTIRIGLVNPEDSVTQRNWDILKNRWNTLWPRITERIDKLKLDYGYQDSPIADDDWVSLRLPAQPFEAETEWSAMLQVEEAGWLIDFRGWEDFGGQRVF